MAHDSANSVTAPASITLLGDYGTMFGEPALALAVEHRFACKARMSNKFAVNGEELDQKKHPLIRGALLQGWTDMDKPILFETGEDFPDAWGWGISGRVVACLGALSMFHDHIILEEVARRAFEAEFDVLKNANPLHCAASTYGSTVFMSSKSLENALWKFKKDGKEWYTHMRKWPGARLVLGDTGITSPLGQMREKVSRFYERNAFARDIIKDVGQAANDGEEALRKGDVETLGRMMTANQKLLVTLGVSHQALDRLIIAAARHSYGAKLVGAGGGGCIIALTDEPDKTIAAINSAGGKGSVLNLANEGLRIEDGANEKTAEDEPTPSDVI